MTNKTKKNISEDYIYKKIYDSNGKGSNTFSKDRYEKAFNAFVKLYHHFNDGNDPVVKEGNPSSKRSEQFASQMLFASVSGLNLSESRNEDKVILQKIEKNSKLLLRLLDDLPPEYLQDMTQIIGPKDFRAAAFPDRAVSAILQGASNLLTRNKIKKYELLIDSVYTNWPTYEKDIPERNGFNIYKAIICVLQGAQKEEDLLMPTSAQDLTDGIFDVDAKSHLYRLICEYLKNNKI